MRAATTAALVAVLCVGALNAESSQTCKGTLNPFPPRPVAPTLVQTVKNGKLFLDNSVSPPLHIVHLYGTDYEMGYAAGQLMKDKLGKFVDDALVYLDEKVDSYLPANAPQWLIDLIAQVGIPGALDLTYQWTLPYTPKHFEDELLGLADGSGIDVKKLRQVNMIPELIKAQCSMVGAWGEAIVQDGSTLYQLRALDWETGGPFADNAAVYIYHPNSGNSFAHLSWLGFVGALTGYSSANVGICEKVWDHYNGTYFVDGYPFHYLLRDILQFDPDTSGALNRIMNAKRTCSIFVGLGDSDTNQFRAVEYSHDYLNVYSDESYPVYDGHPAKKGVVYINKHVQPSGDACLGDLMMENYGKIDAPFLIKAASLHQTGDNHAAVYDFKNNYMYVASSSSATNGDPVVAAYDRQFLRFDLNQMWAEPKPDS